MNPKRARRPFADGVIILMIIMGISILLSLIIHLPARQTSRPAAR